MISYFYITTIHDKHDFAPFKVYVHTSIQHLNYTVHLHIFKKSHL